MIEIKEMYGAIRDAVQRQRFISLIPYEPSDSATVNEYCLFLKPEVTALDEQHFSSVAQLLRSKLSEFEQTVVAMAAVDSSYLARHEIMQQHYGVIDAIARTGRSAMSKEADARLQEMLGQQRSLDVLGAYQFLERYPYFSPEALAVFYDSQKNIKLSGGTHCVRVTVRGRDTLLFNGFHPEQIEHYLRPSSSILVLVVRTIRHWSEIRRSMTGATNPATAAPESIRAALLGHKDEFGLDVVNSGRNGVHVSAGPLEGMVEISRYMSNADTGEAISPDATTFGRQLISAGYPKDDLERLCGNPELTLDQRKVSAFDATEEIDAVDAISLLTSIRP